MLAGMLADEFRQRQIVARDQDHRIMREHHRLASFTGAPHYHVALFAPPPRRAVISEHRRLASADLLPCSFVDAFILLQHCTALVAVAHTHRTVPAHILAILHEVAVVIRRVHMHPCQALGQQRGDIALHLPAPAMGEPGAAWMQPTAEVQTADHNGGAVHEHRYITALLVMMRCYRPHRFNVDRAQPCQILPQAATGRNLPNPKRHRRRAVRA